MTLDVHWADVLKVNEILGDHNVDKQMTDSRGDVCYCFHSVECDGEVTLPRSPI